MADEQQQHSWWKSLPGILTAATGFVAALSGLVAGLNQLGLFRREQPTQPVTVTAPLPDTTPEKSVTATAPESATSSTAPRAEPKAPPSAARSTSTPRSAAPPTAPSASAPSTSTPSAATSAPTPGGDTTAVAEQVARLPKGTAFELALTARACAPSTGTARATARLVEPVKLKGRTLLPVNTTAVLRLSRAGSGAAPRLRLDSLVRQDLTAAVTASDARIRNGTDGACLRQGARVAVTLNAPVPIRRR